MATAEQNHPVKDLKTGRVYISSQNHGYMVKESSVPKEIAEVAFVNVNDGTVEGLRYLQKKYLHGSVSSGSLCRTEGFGSFV